MYRIFLLYFSAAFLLDVGDEVYVWEGWMPAEITKDKRGSAKRRWDEERKLTLRTTLSYVKGKCFPLVSFVDVNFHL